MSDIIPIRAAEKLGYTIYWNDNHAWFKFDDNGRSYTSGPFKTLEDAAYAAISDNENIVAILREKEAWSDPPTN